MDLGGLWNDAKGELEIAYRDLIALVIASVESLVVIAIAVFVARRLRRRVRSTLNRTPLGVNLIALLANAVSIGVYVLAATFVLALFGVNWAALFTFLSLSTLAISLALQDVLKNFVAGVYLLLERPFVIGDRIIVKDVAGEVESIGIRTTMLRDVNEERIVVPNATIFSEIVTNRTAHHVARTTITLKNVMGNPESVGANVRIALAGLPTLREPAPRLAVKAIHGDGADIDVSVWHDPAADVASDVMHRLRLCFPDATVMVEARQ